MLLKKENTVVFGLLIITMAIALNINSTVGIMYGLMAIGYLLLEVDKQTISWFGDMRKLGKYIAPIVIGFVGWAFLTSFVYSYYISYFGGTATLQSYSFLDSLSILATSIISSNNPLVIVIVWGVLIPAIETAFLYYVLKFFANWAKMKIEWSNSPKIYWLSLLAGITFSLLHLGARSIITSVLSINYQIFLDLVMFTAMGVTIFKYRLLIVALGIHILINTLVSLHAVKIL